MKSALFLETMEEAKQVKKLIDTRDKNIINTDIYSLNPNINAYLKQNNIPSHSSSEMIDENFYDGIMDKCQEIEMYIIKCIEHNNAPSPADYYVNALFYYLRQIWRHFLWKIEFIDRCFSRVKYDLVYGFVYKEQKTGSPWIEDDQLYLGILLKTYCQKKGIQFNLLETEAPLVIRKPNIVKNILKYSGKFIAPLYFRILKKILLKDEIVLIPNPSNNMDKVCRDLKLKQNNQIIISMMISSGKFWYKRSKNNNNANRGVDLDCPLFLFYPWKEKRNDSLYRPFFETILTAIKDSNETFIYNDIGFRSILVNKIEMDLVSILQQIHYDGLAVKKLLKIIKPTAVLSQMALGTNGALGYWAKHLNIPAVLISHGSHVVHEDQYAKREHEILAKNILTSDYEYLAVQSPLAKDMALLTKKKENIFKIKPAIWGRNINKNFSSKDTITITHAGTPKFRHQRRFIYETADEYVSALIDICNAVRPCKNIKLIIKTRPQNYELSMDSLNYLLNPLPENTVIETEKPFSEVLSMTDLLISFSSTTIEEALVNEIPVLLYGGKGRYAHIPVAPYVDGDQIEQAVTFIKNKDSIDDYFKAINQRGSSFTVPPEEFDSYRFRDGEALEFSDWFADKIKSGIAA